MLLEQQRRMVASSPRRCQGRPSVSASNCCVLSCNAGAAERDMDLGNWRLGLFRRSGRGRCGDRRRVDLHRDELK
jgi:hypothetical protein